MRKVYHNEKSSLGLAVAVSFAVAFTAVLFGVLPFLHTINKSDRTTVLTSTTSEELPPAKEEKPPPPPEVEKAPEAPPEPKLVEAQEKMTFNPSIELALGKGPGMGSLVDLYALTAKTAAEDAFSVSDLEKRPEATQQVAPTYPEDLRKAKVEGSVTLIFVLSEDGKVEDPRVESSSRPEFEKPAIEAIRKWRFRPGMKDGQAVRTYLRIPMRFRVSA